MLGYGISEGYSDLRKTTNVYAIDQKGQQGTRQLVLLRNFEKGILVRDVPARRIEFIRWENISAISRLLASDNAVGYLCLLVRNCLSRQRSKHSNSPTEKLMITTVSDIRRNSLRSLIPPQRLRLSDCIEAKRPIYGRHLGVAYIHS
jgi:hypothetical protein